MCVSYTELEIATKYGWTNYLTINDFVSDAYPIPRMEEFIDKLGGAKLREVHNRLHNH